jgi:superfamily II DNA or RNA helicase
MAIGNFSPGDLVRARGREWVVLPGGSEELLRIRPLSGSEDDALTIAPALEFSPPAPAIFGAPSSDRIDTQDGARLLADGLRLSLRRGAGPFRSAAHLGVEPRAYQLVPLMMAMKLSPVRLLIADDVGVGKTIEAGMIVRELLDRGQADHFAVLCPPHLVDQWVDELAEKFDIDAVAVTASRARSLERGLPTAQSLFDAYPHTVVSLDYIKSDRRREDFARACPPLVIVDEAHSCVGGDRGRHQRYDLLRQLSGDPTRHLLLLTATPHSGDEEAFDRLLGLLNTELARGEAGDANAVERYRRRLAQHFVQRRRADIQEGEWQERRAFPRHEETDETFSLIGDFAQLHDEVLDYCLTVTRRAGGDQARQRLAFWGTLALMRCVGSSPAAAASALRNRLGSEAGAEALEPAVFDADEQGLLADGDLEPSTALDDAEERAVLERLIRIAEGLDQRRGEDPKNTLLVRLLKSKAMQGHRPVIFCRFIATAEAVGEYLKGVFRKHRVEVVTGRLTPDERRTRIDSMEDDEQRILIATDCLSEGINLQGLFDAVIHYDLSWNPTRHQQREGRVDRFGQKAPLVRTAMIYGENSAIDGAVLKVVIEKAKAIRRATGVAVPLPEENETVAAALMQALLLRSGRSQQQLAFDFGTAEQRMEVVWRDVEASAKASRSRYAQGALRPDEVLPEWRSMRALGGGPEEVSRFTRRALQRMGAPLQPAGADFLVHYTDLPEGLRERLAARGLTGTRRIRFEDRPAPDAAYLGRVHPLIATLAEGLTEGALDPLGADFRPLGRAGAWITPAVEQITTVLVLRLRFKLITSGRLDRMLLAEEATALAFSGMDNMASAKGTDAMALLEVEASANLEERTIRRRIDEARERLGGYEPDLARFARERGGVLSDDHVRLTEAAGGGATVEVTPVLPADVIGLYVLIPGGE